MENRNYFISILYDYVIYFLRSFRAVLKIGMMLHELKKAGIIIHSYCFEVVTSHQMEADVNAYDRR